jgi:LacI family transcriptional regulator
MSDGPRSNGDAPAPVADGTRREPRLIDVASRAGVHVSTASRALDPERRDLVNHRTAARVAEAALELGYTVDLVARGLKRGRSGTIGVLVTDFGNPFLGPLLRGIGDAVEQQGAMPIVVETRDDPVRLRRELRALAGRRVDGFIVTAARDGDAELLRSFAEKGTPVILAVRDLERSGLPSVVLDDELGGTIVAEHLAALGHRRVTELPGFEDILVFRRRTRGFRRTCEALGLEVVDSPYRPTMPTVTEGRQAMDAVLGAGRPWPTAVFAHNDLMAVGALESLAARGLECPRDMSVVGFNDSPLTEHLSPPLTSVHLASEEMGRIAGQMASAAVGAPGTRVRSVLLQPELVVRGSTARLGD